MPLGVSITKTWGTRVAATAETIINKKPIDQRFSGNLILALLLGEQSRANRKTFPLKAKRTLYQGGEYARLDVRYGRSTNSTSFRDLDILPLNKDDIHTVARAKWSYYTDAAVLSWTESQENRGPEKIFSIIDERLEASMDTIKENVDTDLLGTGDGDTVGNEGKNIIGMQHLLPIDPTTGTVWGLNRATYSWWRNQAYAPSTTFASGGIAALAHMWLLVSGTNGEDPTSLLLTTPQQWEAYHAKLSSIQEIQTTTVGDLGFRTLEFMGRPIFYSSGVPDYTWYFLNFNYINALLKKGNAFRVLYGGSEYKRQMIEAMFRIVFSAQIAIERFDRQGVIELDG